MMNHDNNRTSESAAENDGCFDLVPWFLYIIDITVYYNN